MEKFPLPENIIKLRISYVFSAICLILAAGVSYGGFVSNSFRTADELLATKHEIAELHKDLNRMHEDFASLRQSVDDLKESLNRKH